MISKSEISKGDRKIKFDRGKDTICIINYIGQLFDSHAYFPLGVAYISGALKAVGYKVKVLDLDVYPELKKEIVNYNYIMIGLSAGEFLKFALDKIEEIKALPGKVVIGGGPLATAEPKKVLNQSKVDYIVYGEAEEAIVGLMGYLEGKGKLENLDGVGYRKNGEVVVNNKGLIKNLDTLAFPDLESFNVKKYTQFIDSELGTHSISWFGSRGCTFDCQFCFHNKDFRGFSPERLVKDMKHIRDKYEIDGFLFLDDNFMNNTERVKEFCKLVKPLNLRWGCEARVTSITEEIIREMKDAGCVAIRNGLESGSDRILKVMRKGATVEHAKRAMVILTKLDMPIKGGFMFGAPTETKEDAQQTINLIRYIYKINPHAKIWTYFFTPRPGTPWYDLAVQLGMKQFTLEDWTKLDKYQGTYYNMSNMTEKQIRTFLRKSQFYAFFGNKYKAGIFWRYVTKRENFKRLPDFFARYFYIRRPAKVLTADN